MSIKRISARPAFGLFTIIALIGVLAQPAGAADPADIQRKLNETVAQISKIQVDQARIEQKSAKLETELAEAERTIAQKSELVKARAGYMYRYGGGGLFIENLIGAEDIHNFLRRLRYLEVMGDKDSKLVDGLRLTQSRADDLRTDLASARSAQKRLVAQMREKRSQLEAQFKGAIGAAKVGRFGKFDSFTLPMSPSAFSNTWGDPRSGGRRHKGTDVFGACGQRVVAVTNSVISGIQSGGSGGIMMYIRAGNGDVFFYAHLKGYAAGMREGRSVSTGELIAYNGNTGNARGGPCHIHFEWHPGGGGPVNPYSLLNAAR